MEYDNNNRGSLFKNDRKETDKHPNYKGSLNVAGTDYWISAWIKKSKEGSTFMSLSVEEKGKDNRKKVVEIDDSEIPF
jgi:uncharacterized protein (DUF736 family)